MGIKERLSTIDGREVVALALFSALLSATVVLGFHIHVDSSQMYSGLMDSHYIIGYSVIDIVVFLLLAFVFSMVFIIFYAFLKGDASPHEHSSGRRARLDWVRVTPVSVRYVVIVAAVLFLAWLPYLLAYWPGFVFSDSLVSIDQARGDAPLSNHHPVIYTLFVKLCLSIGEGLGWGISGGCAVYTVIQMVFMAACIAYMICWIVERGGLKRRWLFIIAVPFALSSYMATLSIAMWKDPIFSCALIMLSLLLFDMVASVGRVQRYGKSWWIAFVAFAAIALFFRNNGVYVLAAVEVGLTVLWLRGRNSPAGARELGRISAVLAMMLVVYAVIVGPIYHSCGIVEEKVESLGIPLNQMARVAAYDGDMSESDRAYMDTLMSGESYADVYHPCCVDLLKWDESFDADALDDVFYEHWFSMLVKNPVIYFEAWELETYGYWTVNRLEIYSYTGNISAGVPWNLNTTADVLSDSYGITADNLFGTPEARSLFPEEGLNIPLGLINWAVALLAFFVVLMKRGRYLIALLPTIGLSATLIIASPIYYWPRYGATIQFLVPFYVFMFYLLARDPHSSACFLHRNPQEACDSVPRTRSELLVDELDDRRLLDVHQIVDDDDERGSQADRDERRAEHGMRIKPARKSR